MRIVLDTNVLVRVLHNPDGTPGRIVDLILGGRIQVLYDDRILAEYLDVVARPQLAISPALAQAIVGYIRLAGERLTALPLPQETFPTQMICHSPRLQWLAERMLWLLEMRSIFRAGGARHQVLSPTQFIDSLIVG